MREEKERRRKEKENNSEGRSGRRRQGRRKERSYASGLKLPKSKILCVVSPNLCDLTANDTTQR